MVDFCPLCASDERTEAALAEDGRTFVVCSHPDHGEGGYVWEPTPERKAGPRSDGLGGELDIWDKLLECVPADGKTYSFGEVEDRLIGRYPSEARTIQDRYGHRWREGKRSTNQFTMSAYLAARLSELAGEGLLVKSFGPAEGPWSYNTIISYWSRP